MNKLFFELIRVAIGNAVCLSHTPTAAEWQMLYEMAKKQSLVGICFAGMQKLQKQEQCPPENLYLQWMGMAAKIQQRNEVLNARQPEVLGYFREHGIPCFVLKGQGMAGVYGVLSNLRQSGDIDVWIDRTREQLYDLSRREFGSVEGITYHHIHYPKWDGMEVEVHVYPSFLSSPRRNNALKEFCEIHKPKDNDNHNDVPCLAFNRVYILLHCYRHFCGHGIGLRQLMDYYFVLTQGFTDAEKAEALQWIKKLGMERFAMATMWLMQEVFRLDKEFLLCVPDEKYGRFLLEEVMQSGNFGHGNEKYRISSSALMRYLYNIKRDIRTLRICPHEALWDPFFNVYQYFMGRFIWNK